MRELQSNTRRELLYLVTEIGANDQLVIMLLSDQIIVGLIFILNSCIDACWLPFLCSFLYITLLHTWFFEFMSIWWRAQRKRLKSGDKTWEMVLSVTVKWTNQNCYCTTFTVCHGWPLCTVVLTVALTEWVTKRSKAKQCCPQRKSLWCCFFFFFLMWKSRPVLIKLPL